MEHRAHLMQQTPLTVAMLTPALQGRGYVASRKYLGRPRAWPPPSPTSYASTISSYTMGLRWSTQPEAHSPFGPPSSQWTGNIFEQDTGHPDYRDFPIVCVPKESCWESNHSTHPALFDENKDEQEERDGFNSRRHRFSPHRTPTGRRSTLLPRSPGMSSTPLSPTYSPYSQYFLRHPPSLTRRNPSSPSHR